MKLAISTIIKMNVSGIISGLTVWLWFLERFF